MKLFKEFANDEIEFECQSIISPLDLKSYIGNSIFLLGDIFM